MAKKKRVTKQQMFWAAFLPAFLAGLIFIAHKSLAATAGGVDSSIVKWGFLAASIATGLSSLAAGIAVSYVGSAAVGAISEKPEITGKVLVFVGLAEGIAIYGLIISIMILGRI